MAHAAIVMVMMASVMHMPLGVAHFHGVNLTIRLLGVKRSQKVPEQRDHIEHKPRDDR